MLNFFILAPVSKKNASVVLGDMLLTPDQYQFLFTNDSFKRHGLARTFTHWADAIVPYKVDTALDPMLKQFLKDAMQYISNVSCIEFKLHDGSTPDYVFVTTGTGCTSQVGKLKQGQQTLKLSKSCGPGNIIHELLHTLGFLHMHVSTKPSNISCPTQLHFSPSLT